MVKVINQIRDESNPNIKLSSGFYISDRLFLNNLNKK